MSYRDVLVTARLSYGVDTYYLKHPELKLQSLSTPLSEDLKREIKDYLYKWDKVVSPVRNSAIDTNPEHLEVIDAYFDADTYTSGTAFRNTNTNEIIVAYSGSNGEAEYQNFRTNGTEIFNMRGAMEPAAIEFYRRVKNNTGQHPILTGHSQGVKLASTVAIVENVTEAYGFNPAPTFFTEIQNKAWREFRGKHPEFKNSPLGFVKGLYDGVGEVEYNAESYKTLNSLREGYSGNMTYIASRGDFLSGKILEGVNRQIYLNYVGRWLVLDNAGLHMLGDFFTKENIEKVEAYLNSGREWKTNSKGEIIDINGKVIWEKRTTFLPYEQLFYGLYDDAKGRLTSTLKELDDLYSLRLQWQQNGNLTHNQEIYLDYNKIIIITTGLIETLKMQLTTVTKIGNDFETFATNKWDTITADIIGSLRVLSASEAYDVMSECGVSHTRNVMEPISQIQRSMYKLRTKIVNLEKVLEQANNATKNLVKKDQFLSKMIKF